MTSGPKTVAEIREAFLSYFEKNGHTRVQSSSLIPHNDPTLLFANAGMNQFKDCFLGLDKRPYTRATSAQKCVRAGGKHNDLENVGFTSRHHTFFEMLGNFSFGDYFKKDAIHFAWEFSTKVLGLPKDKLRVTVFETDDESAEIWHKQEGVPQDRIVRFGESDNFWAMGDTGPCGPCSEIFYDQGREVDGDRWLEFWNCVFMQYDRSSDGKLTPLPKPSVDTGMGLERMAAILQGVPSNYDIDLFADILKDSQEHLSKLAGRKIIYKAGDTSPDSVALRVIVDHLRSTSFLIADGVLPSNEGRGYVLRRILRRAVRFGTRLGVKEPFLFDLYGSLVRSMSAAYPELKDRSGVVKDVLRQEEEKFLETLDRGLHLLEEGFSKMNSSQKVLPAEIVFKLYDTFGFPVDLTALIARERNLAIDEAGFQKLMSEQQERARASWKGSGESTFLTGVKEWKNQGIAPLFTGYETHTEKNAKITALLKTDKGAWLSLDRCPFYGESGGQVADVGTLKFKDGKTLPVLDTQKPYEGGLVIYVEGQHPDLKVGTQVEAHVDDRARRLTRSNHTATHLLHAALREILGEHVQQAGSLVGPDRLRFDFSHSKALSADEIEKVEAWVNRAIEAGQALEVVECGFEEAKKMGAMALFGEKYGDKVRTVGVPGFSLELCGGLHVQNTAEIRVFKIVSESAVAAGTRRIEAVTNSGALERYKSQENLLKKMSSLLKTPIQEVDVRLQKMMDYQKGLEKEIETLKRKLVHGNSGSQSLSASFKGNPVEIHQFADADFKILREAADAARKKKPETIHLFLSGTTMLLTLDSEKTKALNAGQILKDFATHFSGRGGGNAQTAQGQLASPIAPEDAAAWFKGA